VSITLRGSRLLVATEEDDDDNTLGYSEPELDCWVFDFFSASCSDNAIATSTHRIIENWDTAENWLQEMHGYYYRSSHTQLF